MFDIAGTELLLIVVIAIIVVGPKDLPRMMRSAGRWARKIQAASGEFRRQIDQLAREAELDDIIADANTAGRKLDPGNMIKQALDPEHQLDQPIMPEPFLKDSPPGTSKTKKEDKPEKTGADKKQKKTPKDNGEAGP